MLLNQSTLQTKWFWVWFNNLQSHTEKIQRHICTTLWDIIFFTYRIDIKGDGCVAYVRRIAVPYYKFTNIPNLQSFAFERKKFLKFFLHMWGRTVFYPSSTQLNSGGESKFTDGQLENDDSFLDVEINFAFFPQIS